MRRQESYFLNATYFLLRQVVEGRDIQLRPIYTSALNDVCLTRNVTKRRGDANRNNCDWSAHATHTSSDISFSDVFSLFCIALISVKAAVVQHLLAPIAAQKPHRHLALWRCNCSATETHQTQI